MSSSPSISACYSSFSFCSSSFSLFSPYLPFLIPPSYFYCSSFFFLFFYFFFSLLLFLIFFLIFHFFFFLFFLSLHPLLLPPLYFLFLPPPPPLPNFLLSLSLPPLLPVIITIVCHSTEPKRGRAGNSPSALSVCHKAPPDACWHHQASS